MWIGRAFLLLSLILGCRGLSLAADVINPQVTTDRAVDTSSVQAMVDSLIKPGMTDEEKALAIFNYVRRTMFHYRHLTNVGGGGALNMINGSGYTLCTPTASIQAELCEAAGLEAAVLSMPGHGSCSVFYGDKWHWMDAFLGGCVWNQERTEIASFQEILDNPSLLARQDPSPVPLFPCLDMLYADGLRFEPKNEEYHKACAPDDASWARRAKITERKGVLWQSSITLDVTLRPYETYVRNWDHEPGMYFLTKVEERFQPPHHFCGIEAEKRDTVNWPYFEPYVKVITSFDPKVGKKVTVKTGRYWANGRLVWKPDLSSLDVLGSLGDVKNLRVDTGAGALVLADASQPGMLEWEVKLPYMLQGGWLRLEAEGEVAASMQASVKKGFVPLDLVKREGKLEGILRPHFVEAKGTRTYKLRLELSGPEARVSDLELITVFQHNMYALPQLMPGRNEVKVVVANPDVLQGTPFIVEFAWEEQGRSRTDRQAVVRSPYTFVINVRGKKLPRMRHLLLANEGSGSR